MREMIRANWRLHNDPVLDAAIIDLELYLAWTGERPKASKLAIVDVGRRVNWVNLGVF